MPSQQSLVGQNLFKELLKKVMSGKEQDSSGKKSKAQQDKVKEGRSMAKTKPKSTATKATSKASAKASGKSAQAKKPAAKTKPVAKVVAKPAPKSKPVAKVAAKPAPKPVVKPGAKSQVPAAKLPAKSKDLEPKTTGKVAPLTTKPVPKPIPKPTPTIAKSAPKISKPAAFVEADEAPAVPKRTSISTDIFSEEELTTFRNMLNEEKRKILAKAKMATASGNIALEKDEMYDEVDLASATVEQNLTLRLLDRDRKLLAEIDHAIDKIDTGDYGFCEGTGEVIPKRRLELRPWTRHSVKYKEQLERMKKSGRGVADEDEAF